MTSFHCTKLCSGDCCAPLMFALHVLDQHPFGNVLIVADHVGADFGAAVRDANDPAKIAELMVMGLRARGVDAVFRRLSEHGTYGLVVHDVAIWDCSGTTPDAILLDVKGHCVWRIVLMPQFRTKLLAIMATPPDESSREACELIVRGET